MPSYRHHDFGNLYIQFDVKFPERIEGPPGQDGYPTSMTEQQVKALESVLPKRKPQAIPPQDAMTEDYPLEKVDPLQEGQRANRMQMDDEDDEMHAGGERVQCASQ
jgi:DnaJ homolog subfamily A member 2